MLLETPGPREEDGGGKSTIHFIFRPTRKKIGVRFFLRGWRCLPPTWLSTFPESIRSISAKESHVGSDVSEILRTHIDKQTSYYFYSIRMSVQDVIVGSFKMNYRQTNIILLCILCSLCMYESKS